VAKIGGKNSAFETRYRESIKRLSKRIDFHTQKISSILLNAYSKPKSGAKYWNTVRRQLDVQYRALSKIYSTWAKSNIPKAHKASMKEIMTRLNRSKTIAKKAKRSFTSLATATKSQQIQAVLVKDAIQTWNAALNLGNANLKRITRKTQQLLLSEIIVDSSIARAIESGNLMNNTFINSINLSNTLAAELDKTAVIIDGKKYVIAGSRKFSPKYYAEMVTRVKFHEAQAHAAIQTAANYSTSLVQVSNHNTTTQICIPYENKVFSISGKDVSFPRLEDIPPFHPNCLHLLFPMFESAMVADGSLKNWQDFSNNRTEIPPSPAGFIPVSKRGE
jgi:hypothetical protein